MYIDTIFIYRYKYTLVSRLYYRHRLYSIYNRAAVPSPIIEKMRKLQILVLSCVNTLTVIGKEAEQFKSDLATAELEKWKEMLDSQAKALAAKRELELEKERLRKDEIKKKKEEMDQQAASCIVLSISTPRVAPTIDPKSDPKIESKLGPNLRQFIISSLSKY